MATVVSLEGKRKTPSLEPLLSLCADDMTQVDREILALESSGVAVGRLVWPIVAFAGVMTLAALYVESTDLP